MQDNLLQNQQQSATAPGRKNSNLDKDNLSPDSKVFNATGKAGFKPVTNSMGGAFGDLVNSAVFTGGSPSQMKSTNWPVQQMVDKDTKEEEKKIQMKAGKGSTGGNTTSQSGSLPSSVLGKMEGAFNTSFSDVKVHNNSSSATNMGALAYAQGNDIHFAPGQYNPNSTKGQELIGHELTHVVQQRQGRVKANTQAKGTPVNDDPGLEKEADDMGKKAAQGKFAHVAGSSAHAVQMKGNYPWSGILERKGRSGLISFIPEIISFIRDQKTSVANVWSKNADIQDFKPGAFALELALTILGAGIGGALGKVAGNVISKVAGEVATDASVDALKKLYEVGYDKLKGVLTSPSNELGVNATKGLSSAVGSGLKDYYVQSVKEMFDSERYSAVDVFTNDLESMTDEELAFLAYTLDESYKRIIADVEPIMQQLTIGYMKLQDVIHVTTEAGITGNPKSAGNKEKIRKFYQTDGKITETDARGGQLLITGPMGGIGKYNSPRLSISKAIASDVNESTYGHLKGAKIKDLPFSVSFRFWASTPNHGILESSLCKVWFVKDGDGSIWVDHDESYERDSNGYNQGREWLARHQLNTSRELTAEEIRSNAPKGAMKLYNAIKNTPINSIIDLDMF
ncbi:DUF4157 domain-containing protein [Fulvivirga ulvae]|uniref:eCIS core domain-containing protein n=1 Tax=Fulvivirga ulvae TaxID=2904245 RepID=UPI001F1DB8EA|nr:DUF4157 domain-containing protein [Fulvivirga ulvae]UII30632.1 DUF4157 domain-containing protein [Fulvivirga ulvae]